MRSEHRMAVTQAGLPSVSGWYFGLSANMEERKEAHNVVGAGGQPGGPRQAPLLAKLDKTSDHVFVPLGGLPVYGWVHGKIREMFLTASKLKEYGGLGSTMLVNGGPWLLPAIPKEWPTREKRSLRAVLALIAKTGVTGEEKDGPMTPGVTGVSTVTRFTYARLQVLWPDLYQLCCDHREIGWFIKGESARLFPLLLKSSSYFWTRSLRGKKRLRRERVLRS